MPVRDGMKNPGIDSYAVPTQKSERKVPMVHCEGWIERDYSYLLGYDPMVVSYEEQPCELGSLLSNIKLLAGHGHQRIMPQAKDYLLRTIQAESRALSVAELVERSPQLKPNVVRSCVWHLLYTRELCADLTRPLNVMTTLIWFPTK